MRTWLMSPYLAMNRTRSALNELPKAQCLCFGLNILWDTGRVCFLWKKLTATIDSQLYHDNPEKFLAF